MDRKYFDSYILRLDVLQKKLDKFSKKYLKEMGEILASLKRLNREMGEENKKP